MIKSFFNSNKYLIWSWGGLLLLFILTLGQVQLTVLMNEWYGEFYDILQKANDIDAFWNSILKFVYIAIPFIFIAMFSFYFAQHYALKWREAITYYYLPLWEKSNNNIEGASQRIQQDTYEFSKALEKLGLGLFNALLTLIAFIPILWILSEKITIPFFKDIEGSLVYIAFITSIGGLIVSYFVGIKLPNIEYDNQKFEAKYRKQLVYSEDDKKFAKIDTLLELFIGLKLNYHKMFNHYSYFTLWNILYQQVMLILPYLLMAPSLFVSITSLGVLTQTGNAFGKVNSSFSYLIDHWTEITKFLSVIKRLKEFEKLLLENQNEKI